MRVPASVAPGLSVLLGSTMTAGSPIARTLSTWGLVSQLTLTPARGIAFSRRSTRLLCAASSSVTSGPASTG